MSKAQLQEKAKALGIDTEGLTVDQLKAAIKEAKEAGKAALEQKVTDAKQAVIDLPEDAADEQKQEAVTAVTEAEEALQEFVTEWFPPNPFKKDEGDGGGDSGDEHQGNAGTAGTGASQPPAGTSKTAQPPAAGKEKKAKRSVFTLNGTDYVFTKNTPPRFNFLGKNRSREEWLNDDVAMELLVSGHSQYVKPLKK